MKLNSKTFSECKRRDKQICVGSSSFVWFLFFFFSFLIKEEKITFKPCWGGEAFAGPGEWLSNA